MNSGAKTTARLIVVVEKDTAFQRLLQVRAGGDKKKLVRKGENSFQNGVNDI